MPMTRTVRRWLEKWFGEWTEGPEPPRRLDDLVSAFVAGNPRATRGEWAEFAREHARMAYRCGWIRGYEHVERDEDIFADANPEELADQMDPSWRWGMGIKVHEDPEEVVPEEWPEEALVRDDVERILEEEQDVRRESRRVVPEDR